MTHRGRGFARGRSTSRRRTGWSAGCATGAAPGSSQTISTDGTTVGLIAVVAQIEGLTQVRLRGELTLNLLTAATANDGFQGAFGVGLFGNEAVTVGVTALPDPVDDIGDERWLYHTFFSVRSGTTTAADVGQHLMATFRRTVDSKAMRKAPPDLVLACLLGVDEIGSATMNWMFNSRVLDKLP